MQSDKPIQTSSEDRFGRSHFANRVAQVITGRKDSQSIVVAIYGPWGEGKTSVLNMIVEELDRHSETVTYIRFNPWRFGDESQLLHGFFSLLAEKLASSLETKTEKASKAIEKYGEALAPLTKAASVFTLNIDFASVLRKLASSKSSVDLEEYKLRVEEVLRKSTRRIVILMDDIDRLDESEIQVVFRLVKLSADFPNTAYVLAFDEERVSAALAKRYGDVQGGRSFLEKIVQVPLSLPPTSKQARRTLALEGLEGALKLAGVELSNDESRRLGDIFDKAFLDRITTPRLAKRFGNALTFALPMVAGEVDIVDLIFLEAIRTFYPELYATIRDNPEVFLGSVFDPLSPMNEKEAKEHVEGTIKTALEIYPEQVKKAASIVIQDLFPRTGASGLFRAGAYSSDFNERWSREKRVASKDYFSRYFNYGVPSDDISDRDVDSFLEHVPRTAPDDLANEFKALSSNNRTDVLIEKLRTREDELPPETAAILALVVARIGNELPYSLPIDRSFGLATYSQACALIRHLLHRVTDQTARESLALEIVRCIEPLPLAFDYSKWMRRMKRSSYSDEMVSVVSEERETEIQRIVVQRIALLAENEPIERAYPMEAQQFYQMWSFVDKESLREYLKHRIEARPNEAAEFISAANGFDPTSETSRDWTEDLGWFDFICDLVPPDQLLAALRKTYPELSSAEYSFRDTERMNNKERAARWFQRFHEQKGGAVIVPEPSSTANE